THQRFKGGFIPLDNKALEQLLVSQARSVRHQRGAAKMLNDSVPIDDRHAFGPASWCASIYYFPAEAIFISLFFRFAACFLLDTEYWLLFISLIGFQHAKLPCYPAC